MKKEGLYALFLVLVLALVFVSYFYGPWFNFVSFSPDNSPGTCIDSDYGSYPSLKGLLESDNYNYDELVEIEDVCFNDTLVVEYSCDSDSVYKFQTFPCKTGCVDGACVFDREAHLLDTYIDVDQDGEYVEIRRDTGEWIVECPRVGEGENCAINDIGLEVSDIYVDEPAGHRWATFSYGQGGRPFRDVFDSSGNRLTLPLLSEFPRSSYTFRIYDVDNPSIQAPIQNVTFSWDGEIIADYSPLIEGKNHNFKFEIVGNAVRLITQSAEGGDVKLSLLYGNGVDFLGMYALDTGGGKLVTSDNNDLLFNLTNSDGHFIVSQAAGGLSAGADCDAVITANISECLQGDLREIYYLTDDSCADVPGNLTYDRCDYNDNGIIGDEDDVDGDFGVEVYIEGERLDVNDNYSGEKEVEFDDDGDLRISFDIDFDEDVLDLTDIYIRTGDDDGFGYIIVNGLDFEKTVYVERLNDDSNSVCIEDREITSISSISSSCSSTGEHLVLCDGEDYSNYTCEIAGDYYKVTGLENSGVLEYEENNGDCTPSWSCSAWGACVNDEESRFCTDANNCGTLAGRPVQTRACTVSTGGQTCSELGGEKCFADETCSISVVSASDGSCCLGVCREDASSVDSGIYFWIVFTILIVAIVVVGVMIFLSLKNRSLSKSLKRFSS